MHLRALNLEPTRSAGVGEGGSGATPPTPTPSTTTPSLATDPPPTPSPTPTPDPTPAPQPGGPAQDTVPPAQGEPKPGEKKPAASLAGGTDDEDGKPKPGDPDPDLDVVPADGKYDGLKLPDGAEPDEELATEFGAWAKEKGVTKRQAQLMVEALPLFQARQAKVWQDTVTGWADQSRKDPDLVRGGFDQNLGTVRRAVAEYGTPGFRQLLNDMGIGNHPEVIKTFLYIGKSMGEASAPGGSSPLRGNTGRPDPANVLYGEKSNAAR